MRTRPAIVILVALSWAGCSTVNYIPEDPRDPRFELARKNLGGKSGILKPVYRHEFDVSNLELSNDSLLYSGQDSSQRLSISFPALYKVTLMRPTSGAILGGFNGLVVGAVFGLLSAAVAGLNQLYGGGYSGMEAAPRVALGAGIGVVLGAIIGVVNPPTDTYYFGSLEDPAPPEPRILPSSVKLDMPLLPEEKQDAVRIVWNGRDIWLQKSDIKIERKGDGIWLTIPGHLLE
jgi:hypothetical protein